MPTEAEQGTIYSDNNHKIGSSVMSHSTDSGMGKVKCEMWNKTMLRDLGMSTGDLAPPENWATNMNLRTIKVQN